MGMEAVRSAVSTSNYQSQAVSAAKPVEHVAKTNTVSSDVSDAVTASVDYDTQVVSKSAQSNAQNGQSANQDDKGKEQPQATVQDMKEINKLINRNTVAEFGYNEPTNRITITIKDKETDEVIREIPSEKALKMLEKAWELAGILVDERR